MAERAESLALVLPRIIVEYNLDESLLDEFKTTDVLNKLHQFIDLYIEDYIKGSTNPNTLNVLGSFPRPLLEQWYSEIFARK